MPDKTPNNKEKLLQELNKEMGMHFCCQLGEKRTNIVPGEGSANAKVMFIGEGPGQKEDEQGRPFVGAAGKLLSELLSEIGLKREDVFIANVVKCRPPNNRDPLPEEVKACWPWLKKQVEIIDPVLMIPLGRHAMERFLPGMKISNIRGKIMRRNIPNLGTRIIFPTYHPAAALYHREWLQYLKEDFKKIPRIIEYLEANKAELDKKDNQDWESMEINSKKNNSEQKKLL